MTALMTEADAATALLPVQTVSVTLTCCGASYRLRGEWVQLLDLIAEGSEEEDRRIERLHDLEHPRCIAATARRIARQVPLPL